MVSKEAKKILAYVGYVGLVSQSHIITEILTYFIFYGTLQISNTHYLKKFTEDNTDIKIGKVCKKVLQDMWRKTGTCAIEKHRNTNKNNNKIKIG